MMLIFYVDKQQCMKCCWTTNISANVHGKQTVSTKQPQETDLTVELPVTSDSQRGNELVFKSLPTLNSMLGDLKTEWS